MFFSKPVAPVALTSLLALSLVRGVALTDDNYNGITIGSPFKLTWSGDGTPVNITLVDGSPANVIPVAAVAINAPSPSFLWTPSVSIRVGEYALAIIQSGSTNYAGPFFIYAANSQTSQPPIATTSSPSSASVAIGLVLPTSTTSSTAGPIVPSTSSIPQSSFSGLTASSSGASGTGGSSLGFLGTGTKTAAGAPYPTGSRNGTWMGTATVGVGAVTVTEDCGCAEETGVSAGNGGNGGGGPSSAGSSASSSGAPFESGAGWGRADLMRVGLKGGALVMGVVAWLM
ncbi:SMP-30 gluconolaconase LRE domain protein [Xylographa pallens]|nr:SMP-30 gluconolaconase LRE domain protein [Xylographa pallens]